jgi:hypothetical protein
MGGKGNGAATAVNARNLGASARKAGKKTSI